MKHSNLIYLLLLYLKSKTSLIVLLLFFIPNNIHSQEVLLVSNGNISSTDGSASYSVGQIIQNTINGSSGSVIQGIQFYFESSILSLFDSETNLSILTYPNPTSSILNIKAEGSQSKTLSYHLCNLLGESISNGNIINNISKINIDHLPAATYLLKINNSSNRTLKTFKIIKK